MLYLTGCTIPSAMLIAHVDVDAWGCFREEPWIKLYIPKPDLAVSMWSGPAATIEQAARQSGLNPDTEVAFLADGGEGSPLDYMCEIDDMVERDEPAQAHALPYPCIDYLESTAPLHYPDSELIKDFTINYVEPDANPFTAKYLLNALHTVRLVKSPVEIEHIREANRITSAAHEVVMRELGRFARRRAETATTVGKNGTTAGAPSSSGRKSVETLSEWEIESEADAEAVFVAACKRAGAGQAYLPIVASGSRASTLHYV